MPYKSAKQRAFMHIHHPEIASRWDEKYGGEVHSDSPRKKALKKRIDKGKQ